jgi:hypothetical protein
MWHVWDIGEVHTGHWWGNLKKRDHLEDQGLDGRIISKRIIMKWDEGGGDVDRIKLAQDRDRWWALVNATGFHKMRGIS